jgi:uncharacterized protein with NRDE domain
MCLIAIAWQAHPDYPLVVAANRDEWRDRPALPAHWWSDHPTLLAGRDLQAGGTWIGVDAARRFGLVTNFRELAQARHTAPSRGRLVPGFLAAPHAAATYLDTLEADAQGYAGFNLLLGDGERLWYASNRAERFARELEPGLHGLSNHLLDTPWPKVAWGKAAFGELLSRGEDPDPEALFGILSDRSIVEDRLLPETGIGLDWERILSARFIVSPVYGTRSSTLLFVDREDHVTFIERSFNSAPGPGETTRFEFAIS